MKYKPTHTYEMKSSFEVEVNSTNVKEVQKVKQTVASPTMTNSKAEQLRELKKLLDEKIITKEEFEKEKKKILESNN